MRRQDFDYELPAGLIAQSPPPQRSGGRMLVLDGAGTTVDARVCDLPRHLRRGDLLVFNDTRVVPARLVGHKPSGGRVEMLLERALEGNAALAQLGAGKPVRAGLAIATPGGTVRVVAREEGLWRIELPAPALEFFGRWGTVPLPPYIRRAPVAADRERYQSLFARVPGAVAAPTASLHFDAALLAALAAQGVERTCVTLHVGAGTFQPLRAADLAANVLHAERASLDAQAAAAIAAARARGGRVVAVGTTVVRTLESAALAQPQFLEGAAPAPWAGETRLFITPGFRFRVTDALFTNLHLPQSSLLMLVCAFAGTARVLAAYREAVARAYRFFSYGDAMFLPGRAP